MLHQPQEKSLCKVTAATLDYRGREQSSRIRLEMPWPRMSIRIFASRCLRSQRQNPVYPLVNCHSPQEAATPGNPRSASTPLSLTSALPRSSQIALRGASRGNKWRRFRNSKVKTSVMIETNTLSPPGCWPDFWHTWRQHWPKPIRLERQRDQIPPNRGMLGK